MTNVTKMPQRQEGQEDLCRLEERMHFLLGQIGECERILRQAKEAERQILELRRELASTAQEYCSLGRGEGA